MKKVVYRFDEGREEMKQLLGGKGANLAEMTRHGLPVPPGFTITTEACLDYYAAGRRLTQEVLDQMEQAVADLEKRTEKGLGDPERPLLVSVRSGAVISMPGMMDTVLNLGSQRRDGGRAGQSDGESPLRLRFLPPVHPDVWRRGAGHRSLSYSNRSSMSGKKRGAQTGSGARGGGLAGVIGRLQVDLVKRETRRSFPQDAHGAAARAVIARLRSWNNQRANIYRKMHKIPDDLGTAVNVQIDGFRQHGGRSGTGVAFTRNPSTGEKVLYGEFLVNAQGEDVVAGIRTPEPISALKERMPDIYEPISGDRRSAGAPLPGYAGYRIHRGAGNPVYFANPVGEADCPRCRQDCRRSGQGGHPRQETALLRVDSDQLNQILHRRIDPEALSEGAGQGFARLAGGGIRKGGLRCGHGGAAGPGRGEGDPRPSGNHAGGYSRYPGCPGDSLPAAEA